MCSSAREELRPALLEPGGTVALVELTVDRRGRALAGACRSEQEHDVVRGELELGEIGPVTGSELRPLAEEERHVRTDLGCNGVELLAWERRRERRARQLERGRSIRAASAETAGDGDPLLDAHVPGGNDAGGLREPFERSTDERVLRKSRDGETFCRRELDVVPEIDGLQDGG